MSAQNSKLSWAVGKKTILCVGDAVIDCISIVKRFPLVNVPEPSLRCYWQRGGNAANTCTVLRNLGANVEFFGVLSTLKMFRILVNDMRLRGIKIDNCPRCQDEPPFSSVIVNRNTRNCTIMNCNKSFPYPTLEDFQKLDLSQYGWIHFRGRRPDITLEMMKTVEAYNATQKDKIIISMDFDSSLAEYWPLVNYCEYVFFYRKVAAQLEWKTLKESCFNIDEFLRMRFGINLKRPFFVYLWDEQNVGLMDINSNYSEAPVYKPKKFVDSLGITEVFVGAFIYAVYIRVRSEAIAADFANRMASYKCTKLGFDHIVDILVEPKL